MAPLLFDENLSHFLVDLLAADFPGSTHVRDCGLRGAGDADVWRYAAENGLTIVSKDGDLHQMSLLYGAPPKVVWLRVGNCRTNQVLGELRKNRGAILEFIDDAGGALLVIGSGTSGGRLP
jgi:predicted nuclease of predicted toxin-antitoxin system